MRRRLLAILVLFVLLATGVIRAGCVSPLADRLLNPIHNPAGPQANATATALHQTLPVVDLHADPLLWPRNLVERHDVGAVDIPRLLEGHVALQVMGVPTRIPFTLNMTFNPDVGNLAALLSFGNGWPSDTWTSPRARALHSARVLREAALNSRGKMVLVTNRAELDAALARTAAGEPLVATLLAMEGAYPLEGNVRNLLDLYAAGFRMLGVSHFVDGDVAGSAHGWSKHGLTDFGRDVVRRCEQMGMTLDLAHASPETVDGILDLATRPVVVSHTGVEGTCPGPRNLSDERLVRIGKNGGVVGIGLFAGATCGHDVAAAVAAMEHVMKVAGPAHVALGSDFDGAVGTPIDAAGWVEVTHLLLQHGHTPQVIAGIMGGNALRVLRDNLKGPEAGEPQTTPPPPKAP
jgi:membrane dipeptidase